MKQKRLQSCLPKQLLAFAQSGLLACILFAGFFVPIELFAQSLQKNPVQNDQIIYEQGLIMVEAELFQLMRFDNRVDQRPYQELLRKVEKLEQFGIDLRNKSMDTKVNEALDAGLQINRLYKHILHAYRHFFSTNFTAAKSILEELHQQTAGTTLGAAFNLLSRTFIYDLRRASTLPVYGNGDLMALDKVRVGDFLRIHHWSNCRFEMHARDYAYLRCLLQNTRDELLIPVETETARQVLSVAAKPQAAISTCRLHKLIKKIDRFEILCQVPQVIPPVQVKELSVSRWNRSINPTQSNQIQPRRMPPNPQAYRLRKTPNGKVFIKKRATQEHRGIAGVVEVPREQRQTWQMPESLKTKAEKPVDEAVFESDREKTRYQYQLPDDYKNY